MDNKTFQLPDLLKKTRQYFWNLGFTEIEIPYLNNSLPLEPNIYPFKTKWEHSSTNFYLPTSPEMALKNYLATEKKDCFAISHCFRDLENSSPQHTPEFLMLEYYLVNKNLDDLQESLKNYLSNFLNCKFLNLKLPSSNFSNEPDFNQYFLNEIEPNLPRDGGVFITGYPSFLSPLAKSITNYELRITNYQIAKRFELYINGVEIANGCEENRDPNSIKIAFEKENKYRQENNLPLHPYSEKFIADCSSLPPSSGLGLGLNRLLNIIKESDHLIK